MTRRSLAGALLLVACTACRPTAPAPHVVWRGGRSGAPLVATITSGGRPLVCQASPDGQATLLDPRDPTHSQQLTLPPRPVAVLGVDLDVDGRQDVVCATPTVVAAQDLDGRPRWSFDTHGTPPTRLAAADLTGNGRPLVLLAGSPPISLTAIAADGALAWHVDGLRTVHDLAVEPATPGFEGAVFAVTDEGTIVKVDAIGQIVARWMPTIGREARPMVPLAAGLLGPQLVLSGDFGVDTQAARPWAICERDGRTVVAGELATSGAATPQGRRYALTADYRPGRPLTALVDSTGQVAWLSPVGRVAAGPRLAGPVLSAAVLPPAGERPAWLLLGTADGVVAVGW